jgi:hypothetical protein
MAVKRTTTQAALAMAEKMKRLGMSMDKAVEEIRAQIRLDMQDVTNGAKPSGQARINWLARMGHPYGRGQSAAESTPTGRIRGVARYKRGPKVGKRKGSAPRLPIGRISGNLTRSAYVTKRRAGGAHVITAGFGRSAKGSIYVVLPAGTRKMVGRGVWGKGEKGYIGEKIKSYRKVFRQMYLDGNRKP